MVLLILQNYSNDDDNDDNNDDDDDGDDDDDDDDYINSKGSQRGLIPLWHAGIMKLFVFEYVAVV